MTDAPDTAPAPAPEVIPVAVAASPPLRQRKPGRRAPVADPHNAWMPPWRVKPALRAKVMADAAAAGLSYGAYMRTTFDGSPGPRARRSPIADRAILVHWLAELGKLGSNHNQLARRSNMTGEEPEADEWQRIDAAIQDIRRALMKALGRGD